MDPLLIAGGVVGAVASVAAVVRHLDAKRTRGFQRFAEERGFAFEGELPADLRDLPPFKLFGRGNNRRFRNVVRGTKDDATLLVGDYQYVSGTGKSRTTHRMSFCLVRSEALALPHFFLRPQNRVLDSIGKLFGGKDIDFEDDPAFSRAYVLQSPAAPQRVTRCFTPSVRSHFVELAPRRRILEGMSGSILLEAPGLLDTDELEPLVVDAVTLRRVLAYQQRHGGA